MRVQVPIAGSIRVVNTIQSGQTPTRKGFSIQNVSSVDVYFSDDQRLLDSVSSTNLPTVGHLLPSVSPALPPLVYNFFVGQIFVRAGTTGAAVEVMLFDCDVPC